LKIRIKLETLRTWYRIGYRIASWFVNLDTIEQGSINSRLIEYPFVLQKLIPRPPGKVLDVGCADGGNILAPTLAALGWQVYGIDIRIFNLTHPNFHFIRGDIRQTDFSSASFDYAYAVSTLEHIGLAGRYGITRDDADGDLKAVQEVRRILKPGGIFLLTLPYGKGGIVRPTERVYNSTMLSRLLEGWKVSEVLYQYVDNEGVWHEVSEEVAGCTKTPGGVCVALVELNNSPSL
jgi:SAM-dependent methyltransferase